MASLLATAFLFCNNPAPVLEERGKDSLAASIGGDHWSLLLPTLSANPLSQSFQSVKH